MIRRLPKDGIEVCKASRLSVIPSRTLAIDNRLRFPRFAQSRSPRIMRDGISWTPDEPRRTVRRWSESLAVSSSDVERSSLVPVLGQAIRSSLRSAACLLPRPTAILSHCAGLVLPVSLYIR